MGVRDSFLLGVGWDWGLLWTHTAPLNPDVLGLVWRRACGTRVCVFYCSWFFLFLAGHVSERAMLEDYGLVKVGASLKYILLCKGVRSTQQR